MCVRAVEQRLFNFTVSESNNRRPTHTSNFNDADFEELFKMMTKHNIR
jgi:hypothetical protein